MPPFWVAMATADPPRGAEAVCGIDFFRWTVASCRLPILTYRILSVRFQMVRTSILCSRNLDQGSRRVHDKGKPAVRSGRKAMGLHSKIARPPNGLPPV